MKSKTKWRGIQTTQKKVNESKPITIMNRFGQKSISLPRIDDKKRWAGYPGITGVSRKIAELIPNCEYYVEPFAGTAKVYQMLSYYKFEHAILNDRSKFVYEWLKREFKNVVISRMDFTYCISFYNYPKTFFLIDEPWFKSYYKQDFSCFDRFSVKDYDEEVLRQCEKITGKFIITTRKENNRMLNSGYNNYLIESEYIVCGKLPKVLLTTNLNLSRKKGIIKI